MRWRLGSIKLHFISSKTVPSKKIKHRFRTIFSIILIATHVPPIDGRTPDEPPIMQTSRPAITTTIPSQSSIVTESPLCFYADPDLCATNRDTEPCRDCFIHSTIPNSLVCCNVTDIEKAMSCVPPPTIENSTHWTNIHMFNVTLDQLDLSNKYWKRLDSLAITDGRIRRLTNIFSKFSSPKCINMSANSLLEIQSSRAFKELVRLQYLDISNNNLSTMPNFNIISTNLTLDIRGNNAMLCKPVLETIERGGVQFADPDATFCLINQTFHWFNSTDSIPLRQLERMKLLQTECPIIPNYGNCTCNAETMNYEAQDGGAHLVYSVKVDCSGLGLIELPENLPMNTMFLNISNNNITSLAPFNGNLMYESIVRLYADDNQISSLLDLEGTKFIENFDLFYLRRNAIKTLPMYLLSNSLDKTPDGRMLYLEGNHLHCDCNSAKGLKLWLLERQNHITDYDRIICENTNQRVIDLSELKMCQSHHDWTDYIYYLIAAEVLLLSCLIMKVSYDYWIFKTAGYLPWPASKMPKMPCDWLCET